MKKILCLLTIMMFLLIGSQAWAIDGENTECLIAQTAAQAAVAAGDPYNKLGKMVNVAAQAANPYLREGYITEECHSCIVSQFAKQIPIAEQQPCGKCTTYDLCVTTDGPLFPVCDPCVAAVCAYDPYCCETAWNDRCAYEATFNSTCANCGCGYSGACGGQSPAGCWCNTLCCNYEDCCADAESACNISCNDGG